MNFFQFTTVGRDLLLNCAYRSGTQILSWYVGLINFNDFSAVSKADIISSHAGWTENTNYSEANRVQWSPAIITNKKVTPASPLTFTISSTVGPIKLAGYFVNSENTKGGTTGTLLGMKIWDTPIVIPDLEPLYIPVTFDMYIATLLASGTSAASDGEGLISSGSGGNLEHGEGGE